MNPVSIPSKYENNEIMLKSCTGYIPVKNQSTLAPQSLVSVKRFERVDNRVSQIL